MRRPSNRVAVAAAAVVVLATGAASASAATASPAARTAGGDAVSSVTTFLPSCAAPTAGHASCFALLKAKKITHSDGTVTLLGSDATPSGYGPSDLRSAYALPSTSAGSGQTVAIVDAYDDPTAEQDLATYRATYGE